LKKRNISTALDFSKLSEHWVKQHMTIVGVRLLKELRGESCLELDEVAPPKKNICTSRSFGKKVNTFDELKEATASYAAKCAKKLRQQKSCANLITVFVTTNRYSENDRQYSNSKTICMPVASNSDIELIHYASIALKEIYRDGY